MDEFDAIMEKYEDRPLRERLLDFPNLETHSPEVGQQKQVRLMGQPSPAPSPVAEAPPPKVVPKALTGGIPQNWKGKGK
jgi:hypothetical protein